MENTTVDLKKLEKDYEENFRPRKETNAFLNLNEIPALLENKDFQKAADTQWHFNFYVRQVLKKSIEKMITKSAAKRFEDFFKKLLSDHRMYGTNKTRSHVAFLMLSHPQFKKLLSKSDLFEIFYGTSFYDDYCAELAYEEYLKRKE